MTEFKINTISVEAFKKQWDTDLNIALIDVRELDEWNQMHILGAVHIPKDLIKEKIESIFPDHTHPIYLHCLGGVRSFYAANDLLEMGYEQVFSIDGGVAAWADRGYPVQRYTD